MNSGISFLGLLTIAFIVLKFLNIISWSWWLVLLPFYGPTLIIFLWYIFIYYAIKKRMLR